MADTPMPLDDATVAAYRADGYIVLRHLFDSADVELMRSEATRLLEWMVNASLVVGETSPRLDVCQRGERVSVRKIQPVNDLSPELDRLCHDERLLAPLRQLLGAEPIVMEEKLNYKQLIDVPLRAGRDGDNFEYHHDHAYFRQQGYPEETLTVGIMVDGTMPQNGPMRMIPGSHTREWPLLSDGPPLIVPGSVDDSQGVDILGEAGDVVVFHSRLVHASADNTTDRPRRLMLYSYYPSWHAAEPDQRNRSDRARAQAFEARYASLLAEGCDAPFTLAPG
ncbi:MAG: phytanoyl-CoA dioxygenase family protein [Candidatus Dormibacteria bacterium]